MHVLLVAYRFPPQAGGGVIRPLKFAKFLSRAGVKVTVLTVKDETACRRDPTLLRDLPEAVKVVAVRESGWMPYLLRIRRRRPGLRRLIDDGGLLARWALKHWMIPDERSGFVAPAALAAARNGATDPVDVVIATGGPFSCFVAGERIARRLKVPLVLDYRDPWTTGPRGWGYWPGARARKRNPSLERRLLKRSTAIISAHAPVPALLERDLGLPGLAKRCHWIPNGYDPEDFVGLVPRGSDDLFAMTYAGSLYGSRSLQPVVRAMEELGREGQLPLERVRLRVLGVHSEKIQPKLPCPDVPPWIENCGVVSHAEALSYLLGSTVNVLVDVRYEGLNVTTPGKLYEYLASGRPVLVLSPEGVTADLVREARAGWVVRPDDPRDLRETIARIYDDWAHGRPMPRPSPDVTAQYDRGRTTVRLAELLQAIVAEWNARAPQPLS